MNELSLTDFSSNTGASDAPPVPTPRELSVRVSPFDQTQTTNNSIWAAPVQRTTGSAAPMEQASGHGGVEESPDPVPGPRNGPVPKPQRENEPAPAKQRFGRRFAGVAALVAVAVGGGVVGSTLATSGQVASGQASSFDQSGATTRPVDLVTAAVARATAAETTSHGEVASLIARTLPSVVDISVELSQGSGTGSGFVISSDGRIVTNAHVVADATRIEVTFSDKTKASASVLGVDRTDDLAVIQVARNGLPALALGSSAALRMGDPVVAIGSALALTGGPTATEGIVSALDRTIDTADGEHLAHLVQTDAAINPGNSGGPLLTLDGKVVGINSAGSTGAQNIGFAIAIDTAKPIVSDLAKGRAVTKGFLGVSTTPIDANVAAQYGLDTNRGLLVVEVTAGSAASQAGLRSGDVIVSADGKATDDGGVLADAIHLVGAGGRLALKVRRDGTESILTPVLSSHLA